MRSNAFMNSKNSQLNERVFINGDDFGMSPGINKAIEQLHQRRRLTGVSIVANMPWTHEALNYARSTSDLNIGTHLNLTTGLPVLPSDKVPSLVNSKGRFYELGAFLSRYYAGRLVLSEIKAELEAQIEICLDSGVEPQNIDSHNHFHAIPALGNMVNELSVHYGVPTVRNPDLAAFVVPPFGRARLVDKAIKRTGARIIKSVQKNSNDLANDPNGPAYKSQQLIYLRWFVRQNREPLKAFQACLTDIHSESLEIIAHPAIPDEELPSLSKYVKGRSLEFDFLESDELKELLEKL